MKGETMVLRDLINTRVKKKIQKEKTERDLVKSKFNIAYIQKLQGLSKENPEQRKKNIKSTFELLKIWNRYDYSDASEDTLGRFAVLKGQVAAISDLKKMERKFGNNVFGEKRRLKNNKKRYPKN